MNWLLIVLVAGNFQFVKITDSYDSCVKMGQVYTQGINHAASFVCLTP
jgi:hypothetical protein